MSRQDAQPATSRNQPLAYFPMYLLELVKCISGNIASGNCNGQHDLAQAQQIGDAALRRAGR